MANPPPTMPPVIDRAMLGRIRDYLTQHNWLVVHVPQDAMHYTVGLTTYGLPELVVLGQDDERLLTQIDRWAARMVAGELLLGHTITVHDLDLREHTYPIRRYDVATRGGLWVARALYGPRLVVREIDMGSCPCLPCRAAS